MLKCFFLPRGRLQSVLHCLPSLIVPTCARLPACLSTCLVHVNQTVWHRIGRQNRWRDTTWRAESKRASKQAGSKANKYKQPSTPGQDRKKERKYTRYLCSKNPSIYQVPHSLVLVPTYIHTYIPSMRARPISRRLDTQIEHVV